MRPSIPPVRSKGLALALAFASLSPGLATADDDLPPKGQVDIKTFAVAGSSIPKIVVRAVIDVAPKKVWAIVSDCAHYKEHMPRIAASELLKKDGKIHTCKVTVEMPFPLSNLTGITEAVHEESDAGMSRRWKLVSGDYKVNTGSWEVKPLDGGASSLVVYTIHAEPNTNVPQWIREAAQKKALPDMIQRVKDEASRLP